MSLGGIFFSKEGGRGGRDKEHLSRLVRQGLLGRPERPLFTPGRLTPSNVCSRGRAFPAPYEVLSKAQFVDLGFNPAYFTPRLRVFYPDEAGTRNLWAFEKLTENVRAYYEQGVRRVVMSFSCRDKGVLAHEVAHDIYRTVLSHETRERFNRSLAEWVSRAINRLGQPKLGRSAEALFYRAVEVRLKQRLKINLTPAEVKSIQEGVPLKEGALSFASEAFAYGAEIYLGYLRGEEFGELPREMRHLFDQMQIAHLPGQSLPEQLVD